MKTISLFIIGLIATFLFVTASVLRSQNAVATIPCACDDANRYDRTESVGGGARVEETSACGMIKNFEQRTGANRGGYISKKVLDNIFCNKTFNGINFYFAMDTQNPKLVKLVIEGARNTNSQPGALGTSTDRYINQTYCPPSCGSFSVERCK